MQCRGQIGFSQRIRLDWLEYTANLVLAGNSREEIVAALGERLKEKLSVGSRPARGNNRDKAITILTRVWVTVPGELQPLRDEGLDHLRCRGPGDRMLVHWCMCMAAYPFFGTVADAVGRLLRLQGTAGAAQVQRRLRERFGERETVARAARRILRAYIDWGVLLETGEKGIYRGCCEACRRRRATRDLGHQGHALCGGRQSAIGVGTGPRAAVVPFRCGGAFGEGDRGVWGFGDLPQWTRPGSAARSFKVGRSSKLTACVRRYGAI